jgi:hypothetical protein
MNDPVDITYNVALLIRALGLDGDDVRTITLDATKPNTVEVTLYQRDSAGNKHVDENGDPATTTTIIAATTRAVAPSPSHSHSGLDITA